MRLTSKHGRGNKIHLSLDGEYVISTTEKVWYDSKLTEGMDINDEEWAEFVDAINFEKMYERALDLLDLRDHSQKEILDKLCQKFGYDKREQAKLVLEKLAESGLLDDEHFARIYAEELVNKKHVSPAGLRAALSSKGISKDVINMLVDEMEIDPKEAIEALLDTKFKSKNLLDEKQVDKIINSLYGKGFMLNDIKMVLADRTSKLRLELLEDL